LGENDRRKREQDLSRQIVDLQRKQREYTEDLNLRRNQELAGLLERANKIIRQIAESERYDLILQEAVYRSPRVDITERVLKALADGK
jgi:outer membrane protein